MRVPGPDPTTAAIEAVFRGEARRLISVLTRIFGPRNLELAEDVVQEAFMRALARWSEHGIPANPGGWLLATARNRAIDAIRRERTRRDFAADLAIYLDSEWTLSHTVAEAFEEECLGDDQLRMIFMCCDNALSAENRTALILKTLCGLGVPAIARALLTTESTINKRLYRTRRQVRNIEFALPAPERREMALATVHTALYLLFNEGYLSTGSQPILRETCREALAMTRLLSESADFATRDTMALLALMLFNTARLDARTDQHGALVPLDRQDRRAWDHALIRTGYRALTRSRGDAGEAIGRFHLEAAIAARHCSAPTFADTDWGSICRLYDHLEEIAPSPMVALNRAVAVSYRDGPESAIPIVESLRAAGTLEHSHTVAAVLANLHARAGSAEPARRYLAEALRDARTEHERELIRSQVERAAAGD